MTASPSPSPSRRERHSTRKTTTPATPTPEHTPSSTRPLRALPNLLLREDADGALTVLLAATGEPIGRVLTSYQTPYDVIVHQHLDPEGAIWYSAHHPSLALPARGEGDTIDEALDDLTVWREVQFEDDNERGVRAPREQKEALVVLDERLIPDNRRGW